MLYSSRRSGDEFVKYVQEKGSFGDTISFGQRADPCVGIFSKVMSCFRALDEGSAARKYDNLNVALLPAVDVPGVPGTKGPSSTDGSQGGNNLNGGKATTNCAPSTSGHRGSNSSSNLWVTTDNAALRTIDPATLTPLGPMALQSDLHPSLKGALSCAHPQRCPQTNDLFNFNLQVAGARGTTGSGGPTYRIFRVSAATGRTEVLATLSRPDLPMAYVHSFFLSARFVVLRLSSAHFAGRTGLALPWRGSLAGALRGRRGVPWDAGRRCRWFVVDRVHGRGVVGEFETPAAFFFHSVNCWDEIVREDGGSGSGDEGGRFANVFFDVVDFPTMDIIDRLYYDVLLNEDGAAQKWHADESKIKSCFDCSLVRWKVRVPLPTTATPATGSKNGGHKPSPPSSKGPTLAAPEELFRIPSPHAGELPTINPRFRTRPHRYVYSLPQTGRSTFVDTIIKTDTATRAVLQWDNPAGHTPGEAIFVARPGGEAEDDGVLLSVVLDGHAERSYLLCLDAGTMEELGRAEMDFAVAFGLHGMHASSPQNVL